MHDEICFKLLLYNLTSQNIYFGKLKKSFNTKYYYKISFNVDKRIDK